MRNPADYLNDRGKKLRIELGAVAPEAALIIGEPGMGKSVLARVVAEDRGNPIAQINAHPKMRVDQLVGLPRLVARKDGSGVEVVFTDGLLTQMVRAGGTFIFEELSRAPGEALSRLFLLMDGEFRGWSMVENAEMDSGVADNFWLVATMNPTGTRLYTQPLDRALQRRFAYIIEENAPLTDEVLLLTDWTGSEEVARRIVNWATACRSDSIMVNTGDLVKMAKLLKAGFGPRRAFAVAVMPKYADYVNEMTNQLIIHFEIPKESPMNENYPDAVGRLEETIWGKPPITS